MTLRVTFGGDTFYYSYERTWPLIEGFHRFFVEHAQSRCFIFKIRESEEVGLKLKRCSTRDVPANKSDQVVTCLDVNS